MKHLSPHYFVICLLAFTLFSSCSKNRYVDFRVVLDVEIPYNHTPIPGAMVTIVEYKDDGKIMGDLHATGWTTSAVTDAKGHLEINFKKTRRETSKYFYYAYYGFANIQSPYPENEIINAPDVIPLSPSSDQIFRVSVLPKTDMKLIFDNINCQNANDEVRYKSFNMDEEPNGIIGQRTFYGPFTGCGIQFESATSNINSGRQIIYLEAVRNGVTTTVLDTFLVEPDKDNTIHIKY